MEHVYACHCDKQTVRRCVCYTFMGTVALTEPRKSRFVNALQNAVSLCSAHHNRTRCESMAFRSPFQAGKRGVPFPALSPFASSPTQSPENGSPMQTSPAQSKFRSIPKRGTGLRSTADGAPSPMDAAPYTPVSARLNLKHTPAPDSASKLPGRLSFTPHATQQRSPAESASKQSPLLRKSRFNTVSAVTPVSSAADTARPAQLPSLYAEPPVQGTVLHDISLRFHTSVMSVTAYTDAAWSLPPALSSQMRISVAQMPMLHHSSHWQRSSAAAASSHQAVVQTPCTGHCLHRQMHREHKAQHLC